jgi:hypothetical protein
MTRRIKYNGKIHAFPDDVTEEEINSTLNPNQGWKGVAHDAYDTVANALKASYTHPISSTIGAAAGLAQEGGGFAKQALLFPFEAASNLIPGNEWHAPRLTKNLAQGAENFVNTPSHISKYLEGKGIVKAGRGEQGYQHINPFEMGEQQSGDVIAQGIPSMALFGPAGEAGALSHLGRVGARAASGAAMGASQNQNPLVTAFLGAAIPGIGGEVPEMAGNLKSATKNKLNKVKENIKKPINELEEHKNQIAEIKKQLETNKGEIGTAKENAANYVNKELEASHGEEQANTKKLESLLPNKAESETNENLSTALSNSLEHINKKFEHRYNNFSESEAGQSPIKQPFKSSEFEKTFAGDKNISPEIKSLSEKIAVQEREMPGTGAKIEAPPENATVNDYVRFMREARDSAHNAYNKATTDITLTPEQKGKYRALGDKYKALQEQAIDKIKDSISPEHFKQFQKIQEDWGKLAAPFKPSESSGVLHNAAKEGLISDNLWKVLNQKNNKDIKEFLLNNKEVQKALREHETRAEGHPIAGKDLAQQEKAISKLENTKQDTHNLMTQEQKSALKEQKDIASKRQKIADLLSKVNSPKFDSILKSFERNEIKNYSPEARAYIDNIEELHNKQTSIEKKISELMEEKGAKETAAAKRKKQITIAKYVASAIGYKAGIGKIPKIL